MANVIGTFAGLATALSPMQEGEVRGAFTPPIQEAIRTEVLAPKTGRQLPGLFMGEPELVLNNNQIATSGTGEDTTEKPDGRIVTTPSSAGQRARIESARQSAQRIREINERMGKKGTGVNPYDLLPKRGEVR